jgi:hypothetical protein
VLGLNVGEYDRAFEYARKKLDARFSVNSYLERKQGGKVLVLDCWNTKACDYKQEYLDDLYRLIESHTLIWCINYMHSLL